LIAANGLASSPTGPLDVLSLIRDLGYVQIDTIRNVTRAHHHILWSRNQNYREPMLWKLLQERSLFEHFTHDAALIPMEFFPVWQRQYDRMKAKLPFRQNWKDGADLHNDIHERITNEGPLSTHAFDTKITGKKEMWARPPHKRALDHMWYTGRLATCHRKNFTKFYDIAERVIPSELKGHLVRDEVQMQWLCEFALSRLGIATPGELQNFWDVASAAEIKAWLAGAEDCIEPVMVESHRGEWKEAFAALDIEARLANLKISTSRLRILNPFDPLVRDRKRLERIFGFDYKIEIFVPAAKRKWGYYVYPLLEGDRFVGRIELKADRKTGTLSMLNLWPEEGVKWTEKRQEKLNSELNRLARLVGANYV